MKVYITARKEWVYRPEGYDPESECMMKIVDIFEKKNEAVQEVKDCYDEFCKFQYQNYVVMGDMEDLDGLFEFDPEHNRVIDYTEDTTTEIKWEVLEWEVQK